MLTRRHLGALLAAFAASVGLKPALALPASMGLVERTAHVLWGDLQVFQQSHPDLRFAMYVDQQTDNILVLGESPRTGAALGFCITKSQIQDNCYMVEFADCCSALVRAIRQALLPEIWKAGDWRIDWAAHTNPTWKEITHG